MAANGSAKGTILNTLNAAECKGAGIIHPISIVIAVNIISIAFVVITLEIGTANWRLALQLGDWHRNSKICTATRRLAPRLGDWHRDLEIGTATWR